MTREELVQRIKDHETKCSHHPSAFFNVAEVVELADGVLAVRETDGEHTIYFDKSKCETRVGSGIEDVSDEISNFPYDTGFIEEVTSRNWVQIREIAKLGLKAPGRGRIRWHKEPTPIQY